MFIQREKRSKSQPATRYGNQFSGNLTRLERSDWENGAWETRFLSTSLVVDGRISETTIQTIYATGVLSNAQFLTFEYDAEGREIVELQESWDESTQSWELASRELTSYSGTTMVTKYQVYQESWLDATETTVVYDNQGLELERTILGKMSTISDIQFLFTYDSAGNLTEIITRGGDGAGGWINQSRQALTLDGDGDPVELLIQMYEGGMWVNLSRSTFNYEPNETSTAVEDNFMLGLASFDIYPYPAHDRVNVELQLTQTADIQLEVFDVLGRRVEALVQGTVAAGMQRYAWLPNNARAGLYFVRLSVDGAIDTRSIMVIK